MNDLQNFKDALATSLYDMTTKEAIEQNVCIQCKQLPTFYSEAGKAEYQITALCEPCFDGITQE
ncbi:hypothetical protein LCGC14_2301760 [marine sediment metagenome]|uniref:Uncharacterized protein n=1 Tax=marine sediment metagenome TaxID=412755 RepID=A0A0F9FI92_9ZZZZ